LGLQDMLQGDLYFHLFRIEAPNLFKEFLLSDKLQSGYFILSSEI
jgi:hypothetical protein